MRAIFCKNIPPNIGETVEIQDVRAHHLMTVVRVKLFDEILLLDGEGSEGFGKILEIKKKSLTVEIVNYKKIERVNCIDLGLAVPKKEALEDILKICVELNIGNVYFLKTDYSFPMTLKKERMMALLESALIQSNNRYFPMIHEKELDIKTDFKTIMSHYQNCLLFTLSDKNIVAPKKLTSPTLICIGPEAGFSSEDIQVMNENDSCHMVTLDTAILRATTAVICATGYVLGKI